MPLPLKILAPMALGLGGNAVTLASSLAKELSSPIPVAELTAKEAGDGLLRLIKKRNTQGKRRLIFGVVHPFSGHNYELRYWLSACGIQPDRDVEIVVIPPSLMPDALASGMLDGFCVGEPWNSVAIENGTGVLLTTKSRIWRNSPEKVLGVNETFATENPVILNALIRALYKAATWCNNTENTKALAELLSSKNYIGVPAEIIENSLQGKFKTAAGNFTLIEDFFIPHNRAATFPWLSHALWFYSQMVRWGHVKWSSKHLKQIHSCYRPDLYRSALSNLQAPLPSANSKVEGALKEEQFVGSMQGQLALGPDGFFDGEIFDPDDLEDYIKRQISIHEAHP